MITLHPNTNTDKNGNFSILKNIDNLEFVILEDSINNIPENYKKFIFRLYTILYTKKYIFS